MLRFLCHIFKIDYHVCESCQTLREQVKDERNLLLEQLKEEREENKRLNDAIIKLVEPKTAPPVQEYQVTKEVIPASGLFSKRRAILEQRDREEAKAKESPNLGKPDEVSPSVVNVGKREVYGVQGTQDEISKLERELGVEEVNG